MTIPQLYIDGVLMREVKGWETAELHFSTTEDGATGGIDYERLVLVGSEAAWLLGRVLSEGYLPCRVSIGGIDWHGRLHLEDCTFHYDAVGGVSHAEITLRLDDLDKLYQMIRGRALELRDRVPVRNIPRNRSAWLGVLALGLIGILGYLQVVLSFSAAYAATAGIAIAGIGGAAGIALSRGLLLAQVIITLAGYVALLIRSLSEVKKAFIPVLYRAERLRTLFERAVVGAGFVVDSQTLAEIPDNLMIVNTSGVAITGAEVIDAVRVVLRKRLWVFAGEVKLIDMAASPPASLRQYLSHKRASGFEVNQVANARLIRLVRDTSDEWVEGLPTVYETIYERRYGVIEKTVPFAPMRWATERDLEAARGVKAILTAVAAAASVLMFAVASTTASAAVFVLASAAATVFVFVVAVLLYLGANEGWVVSQTVANDKIIDVNRGSVLDVIRGRYADDYIYETYEVKGGVPFAEFLSALQGGLGGIKEIRYNPVMETCEATLSEPIFVSLNKTERVV